MIHRKMLAVLPAMLLTLTSLAMAADNDAINLLKSTGALDRLAKESGVYNTSSTGKTPGFIVDPSFPQPLPHNWMIGQDGRALCRPARSHLDLPTAAHADQR